MGPKSLHTFKALWPETYVSRLPITPVSTIISIHPHQNNAHPFLGVQAKLMDVGWVSFPPKLWTFSHQHFKFRVWRLGKEARHNGTNIVWFYVYEIFSMGKSINTENRLVIARAEGQREREVTANGYRVAFLEWRKGSAVSDGGCTHNFVHFKGIHFMVCESKKMKEKQW